MKEYLIFTDSACDIVPKTLEEWGVRYAALTFRFNGEDNEYSNSDMDEHVFYDRMRDGGVAKTSAANSENFKAIFKNALEEGKDILHLGFSSGLSTTCNSARIAAEELLEEYPDRKIIVIDTLAASAGFGILVYLAVQKKNEGASLEENAAYIESLLPRLCHWFTVDDLVYLKRGGRVSSTAAFVGNMLGIKPVLHVDNEGHLINIAKVRGRKPSIMALAKKYGELAETIGEGPVFISHGDCKEDAEELASILNKQYGVKVELITYVGTVIGAHAGPGVLALFFIGKQR